MGRALVVYFSRSGAAEALAGELARRLGADLERVRPVESYAGAGGYLKGVWQAIQGAAPPVATSARALARYPVLVVVAPVWAGRMAPPMRSYLHSLRPDQIGRVAALWVSGSGAPYKAVGAEIERLTGQTLLASAHFAQREVGRPTAAARLETLAQALRLRHRQAA